MVFEVDIGSYTYSSSPKSNYYNLFAISSKPASLVDGIRRYDHRLHQALDEIYSKRCLNKNWKSTIKPILEQEPILSKHFSKKEFKKFSILWIAVLGCYQQSAELLVRSGADVNEIFGCHDPQVIYRKSTILHVLLQMDSSPENERLIHLVVDHGADLHARDHEGKTVLHYTIKQGRVRMTEMLLEKGANVNAADNRGKTPLLKALASRGNEHELLLLLIKHGVDVFAKCADGQNALHYLTGATFNETNAVDIARVLIEKGVSLDDKENVNHHQPLHRAAMKHRNELVKLYLDHGANVNALTIAGESPLYYAASVGSIAVMETLIKHGANVHLKTVNSGRTALHAVCQCSSSPFRRYFDGKACGISIRLLLSAGADVLAEDNAGRTPLYLMSYSPRSLRQPGILALVKMLALKKALHPSIELKDKTIIEWHQKLRDYYQKCTDEIEIMKSTRFIDSCTIFELFEMRQCQIATLMRNPDFETKFKLHDLNDEFSIYAENVVQAFERAQNFYLAMLEQENVINEAVYYILPDLVVEKVVHYASNCCENVR